MLAKGVGSTSHWFNS